VNTSALALRFAAFRGANAPAIRARGAGSVEGMDNQGIFQLESLRSKALRAHARKSMMAQSRPTRRARAWGVLTRFLTRLGRLAQ
jgi:hypothetical protein